MPANAHPVTITVEHLADDSPDLSWLTQDYKDIDNPVEAAKYREQDRERMESYGHQWIMIGIRAKASVYVNGVRQDITSGGLWGIESDSDADYLRSIEEEEKEELIAIVRAIDPAAIIEEE